jgi:hypothetical protein
MAHYPRDLAAGDEGQVRLVLVLATGLQELREGHPGSVDVNDNALTWREQVGRVGLGAVDHAKRAVWPVQVGDLDCLQGRPS